MLEGLFLIDNEEVLLDALGYLVDHPEYYRIENVDVFFLSAVGFRKLLAKIYEDLH